jgi:hypothetical protein
VLEWAIAWSTSWGGVVTWPLGLGFNLPLVGPWWGIVIGQQRKEVPGLMHTKH